MYNFNADQPSELTVKAGQVIKIAPKEVQQMSRLLSTNWLLATADGKSVGLVPVNYIKRCESSQNQQTAFNYSGEMPNQSQISTTTDGATTSSEPVTLKDEINIDATNLPSSSSPLLSSDQNNDGINLV